MNILKNNKINLLLLSLFLIAINTLKAWRLTVMSLWHDEAFSGLLIQYDLKEMIYRIGLDVHPPFYYLLLKSWSFMFSDSLFSIRMFSVFFGALTVIALYFFVEKAFHDRKLAFFSAILLALSSFQIQYDMEARMYTLGAFLLVLSCYFLLKALETKKWLWWLCYAAAISAGIYTHYYIIFWIFAQVLFFVFWIVKENGFSILKWSKDKNLLAGKTSYILAAVSFLPWLRVFLKQLNQVEESYWIPAMNIWSIPNTFLSMTTGGSTDPSRFWYFLVTIMIFVFWAIIYFLKKIIGKEKWLIFLLLILPFLFAVLISFKTSIYLDRYFIFALPFYLALLAIAIFSIEKKSIKNTLVILAVIGSLISFPARWTAFSIEEKPGMTSAANFLNQEVKNNDKIFVGSSFVYFTFKYHNKTGIHPLLYAPTNLPHFSGTALLSEGDTFSDFQKSAKKEDIVWMINATGFGNYQPEIPENWIKLDEKRFEDTYSYRGWIIVSKYLVE